MADTFEQLGAELKADAVNSAKGLLLKVVDKIPEALEIAAKQTETPIDDAIVAMLKEPLKNILKDLAAKI